MPPISYDKRRSRSCSSSWSPTLRSSYSASRSRRPPLPKGFSAPTSTPNRKAPSSSSRSFSVVKRAIEPGARAPARGALTRQTTKCGGEQWKLTTPFFRRMSPCWVTYAGFILCGLVARRARVVGRLRCRPPRRRAHPVLTARSRQDPLERRTVERFAARASTGDTANDEFDLGPTDRKEPHAIAALQAMLASAVEVDIRSGHRGHVQPEPLLRRRRSWLRCSRALRLEVLRRPCSADEERQRARESPTIGNSSHLCLPPAPWHPAQVVGRGL